MARYDKYDPYSGGFRALLATDWKAENVNKLFGVGLNATGKLVVGEGSSGMVGVIVLTWPQKVRDGQVDVLTAGCVVDFGPTTGTPGTDFGTPGTKYYADAATGEISSTAPTSAKPGYYVGTTVEKDRLEVRFDPALITDGVGGTSEITVTPDTFSGAAAATKQLKVTDDNSVDVTAESTFSSSDEAVATVSASGLITLVATGTATVTANYVGLTATCDVTVS